MSYPALGYPTNGARPMPLPPRPQTAVGSLASRVPSGATASPYAAQVSRYREADLSSAPPGQLIVLLFEKMVLTLRRAQAACEAKRIEERVEHIMKAIDMISHLRGSLDHEQGGTISTQLDALYGFMLRELGEANRQQDPARIATVTKMADELRSAFAGAHQQLTAATAAATTAPVASAPAARVARSA